MACRASSVDTGENKVVLADISCEGHFSRTDVLCMLAKPFLKITLPTPCVKDLSANKQYDGDREWGLTTEASISELLESITHLCQVSSIGS